MCEKMYSSDRERKQNSYVSKGTLISKIRGKSRGTK